MFPLPHFIIITYLIASSLSDETLSSQTLIVVQEPKIDWSLQSHEECGIKYSASENYQVVKYEGIVNISLPTHIISAPKYLVIRTDNNLIFASHSNHRLVQTYKTKTGGWLASFKPGDAHEQYFICDDVSDEKCDSFFPKSGDNYRDFSGEISVTFPIAAGNNNRTHALNTHSFIRNESSADYHYSKLGPSFGQTLYHFQVNESLMFVTKESINGSISMIIWRSDGAKDGVSNDSVSRNEYIGVDPISIYYQQSTNKLYVIMRDEDLPNYSIGWIDPFENTYQHLQDIHIIDKFTCDFDQFMVIDGATLIFSSASEIIAIKKDKIMKLFSASNNLAPGEIISTTYLIPTSYSNEGAIIIYSNGIFYSIHSVQNDVPIIFVIGLASLLILMIAIVILLAIFFRKRPRDEDEEQLIGDSYVANEEVDESVPEAEITPWADQMEPASGVHLIDGEDDEDADIRDSEIEDANIRDSEIEEANIRDSEIEEAKNGDANIGDTNVEEAEVEGKVVEEIFMKQEPSVDHVHETETAIEPIVIVQSAGIEFDSKGIKDGAGDEGSKLETEVEKMSPSMEKQLNPYVPDILANINSDQVTRLAPNEDIQEEAMIAKREESKNNQEEELNNNDEKHEIKEEEEESIIEKEEELKTNREEELKNNREGGEESRDAEKNEQLSSPNVEEDEDDGGSVYEEANEEETIQDEAIQGGANEEEAIQSGANEEEAIQGGANEGEAIREEANEEEAIQGGANEGEAIREEANEESATENATEEVRKEGSWGPNDSLSEKLTTLPESLVDEIGLINPLEGDADPESSISENIIPENINPENIIPENIIPENIIPENIIPEIVITEVEKTENSIDSEFGDIKNDHAQEKDAMEEKKVSAQEEVDGEEEVDAKEEPEDGAASVLEAGKKKKNRKRKKRKQIVL